MAEEDKLVRHYEQAQHYLYKELGLLFQRFNFFLVANSFLVVAVVGLVVSTNGLGGTNDTLTKLIVAIIMLGGFISLAFGVINYINAKIVKVRRDYLDIEVPKIDAGSSLFDMHKRMGQHLSEGLEPSKWLRDLVPTLLRVFGDPLKLSKDEIAYHTWLIPLVFYVFWMAFWWILSPWWYPVAFTGFLLFVLAIYIYILPWARAIKTKKF